MIEFYRNKFKGQKLDDMIEFYQKQLKNPDLKSNQSLSI